MNKQAFYLGALLLVIAALITHFVARGFLEDAIHMKAARISQALKQQTSYLGDPSATQASHAWKALTTTGGVFTALSLVCMLIGLMRHEPGQYIMLLILLTVAVGMPMLF